MSLSDIEKKSLEAHVELCAERYAALDQRYQTVDAKLENLTAKVERIVADVSALRESLAGSGEKNSRQLITIGTSIIAVLIGSIITLVVNLVIK